MKASKKVELAIKDFQVFWRSYALETGLASSASW